MNEIPQQSDQDSDLVSDFEGSDLSSLEESSAGNQKLREPRSQATPVSAHSSDMDDDDATLSDASSLTDIVSTWSSDDVNQEPQDILSDSPLSSLTSEDNRALESKPNPATGRAKRLNLLSKLDLTQPNVRDRAGRTQLFRYAERCDLETCRLLLDADADVNISDNAGWRPLHLACGQGATSIVKLFIERGADLQARGLNHQTALHDAALSGSIDIVRHLVLLGADINARNLEGFSPMDLCTQPECLAFMKEQQEMKREINSLNRDGYSCLHLACLEEDVTKVTRLLRDGADVNTADLHRTTPIHIAAQRGLLDVIAALVNRGALVDLQDDAGNTSLHLATQHGQKMAVQLLLESRSNPLVRNNLGQMPLDLCRDDLIAKLLRDHIIAYSTRAMDMDVLLPRASKVPADNFRASRARYPSPMGRTKSGKFVDFLPGRPPTLPPLISGFQAPQNQPNSSPSQLADPHTPNSGSLGTFLEDQLLSGEARLGLQAARCFSPLYCVKLLSALELGYLVLDFQVQRFLRLPQNSLLSQYPRLTHRELTAQQKRRMWPAMYQMLKRHKLPGWQFDRSEFLRAPIHFVRWLEVVALVTNDYPQLRPYLNHVALDINYGTSLAEEGPEMSGDEGFPPDEVLIRDSSSETSLPTPPVRRPPPPGIPGGPAHPFSLTSSHLQRYPSLRRRPDLHPKKTAGIYINRFHPYRPQPSPPSL